MKQIKKLKRWGIYELNAKERDLYGFGYAVIHPDTMEAYEGQLEPTDTDIECDSLNEAINWVNSYE